MDNESARVEPRALRASEVGRAGRRRDPPVTRLLIVARVRLYREGLAQALSSSPRVRVVGTAADADSGLARTLELQPTVALIDLEANDCSRLVAACARHAPGVKMLALTLSDTDAELLAVAQAGVSGYVTHDSSLNDLVGAVESVAHDEMLCSPRVAASLLRQVGALAQRIELERGDAQLTARELEILELIDKGRSNKEIARELFIEVSTVKNHVHNILDKLSVGRRADAAAKLRGLRATWAFPPPRTSP